MTAASNLAFCGTRHVTLVCSVPVSSYAVIKWWITFASEFVFIWNRVTVWHKARMKASEIYRHGDSYGDSWSSHGFNSFSWNKWSLQCSKRTAFTAWHFFLIWLNWWSRTSKIAMFFSFAEERCSEGICAVNVSNHWDAWCYYLNSVLCQMKFSSYFTEQQ